MHSHSPTPSPSPQRRDPLLDVAWFNGVQVYGEGMPSHELWTLVLPLPGLMVGSTYDRPTVERALATLRASTLDTLCARADATVTGSHQHN